MAEWPVRSRGSAGDWPSGWVAEWLSHLPGWVDKWLSHLESLVVEWLSQWVAEWMSHLWTPVD